MHNFTAAVLLASFFSLLPHTDRYFILRMANLGTYDQLRKKQVWTNTVNYCLFAVLNFTH